MSPLIALLTPPDLDVVLLGLVGLGLDIVPVNATLPVATAHRNPS